MATAEPVQSLHYMKAKTCIQIRNKHYHVLKFRIEICLQMNRK